MQEIAALLLCKIGGKAGSAEDIKAVIEAAGLEADEEKVTALLGDVDGKEIDELLAEGMEKLKDVPMGGGGGGGGGGGAAGGGEEAAAEEEEEEEEEEAPMGGGDMFGDAGDGGDY